MMYYNFHYIGVTLSGEGLIHLSSSSRGLGVTNEISSAGRPLTIWKHDIEIASPGKFAEGVTEIPFEFIIASKGGQQLVESYHGVYVSVIYALHVSCERGMMKKALHKDFEFIVEVPTVATLDHSPATFDITPESLENVNASILAQIPKFKITGKLHRSTCSINQPFTGEVIIAESGAPIRAIELQLVRVESISSDGIYTREATEIQNIQIGEGDVCRDMVVPMYMVFPRLFSCPTVISTMFKIEFEVNLVVVFGDGYMVTENFPITIIREA